MHACTKILYWQGQSQHLFDCVHKGLYKRTHENIVCMPRLNTGHSMRLCIYTTKGEHRHISRSASQAVYTWKFHLCSFLLLVLLLIFPLTACAFFYIFFFRFAYPYSYQALTLSPLTLDTLNILYKNSASSYKVCTKIHGHFFSVIHLQFDLFYSVGVRFIILFLLKILLLNFHILSFLSQTFFFFFLLLICILRLFLSFSLFVLFDWWLKSCFVEKRRTFLYHHCCILFKMTTRAGEKKWFKSPYLFPSMYKCV